LIYFCAKIKKPNKNNTFPVVLLLKQLKRHKFGFFDLYISFIFIRVVFTTKKYKQAGE